GGVPGRAVRTTVRIPDLTAAWGGSGIDHGRFIASSRSLIRSLAPTYIDAARARSRAVRPDLSFALGSAPAFSSARTFSGFAIPSAAYINTVMPLLVRAFTSAPAFRRAAIMAGPP